MSSRVGGAVLALAAAALLAVPMATSALLDAGGWWSGHPTLVENGKARESARKEVYVGFFGARGCDTGNEDRPAKCEGLTKLLPTAYTITALVEAALTGLAAIIAIGLGVTSLQAGDGRKVLAKLMFAALAVSAAGAIALVIIGPSFKGMNVAVPFGLGFYMFVGANVFAGTSGVLALRTSRPPRVKVPKVKAPRPVKPPKAVAVSPIPSLVQPPHQPPPQQPFDVQALFAEDHMAMHGRHAAPIAPGGALPGPSGPLVPPQPEPQPLFQSAPQLRPLYEVGGGESFVPQPMPQQLPMRPPTPIPRAEINAAMGIPSELIEGQPRMKPATIPPESSRKPTTIPPPPRSKPTTIPPTVATDPYAITASPDTMGPSAPTLFGTAPGPGATAPALGTNPPSTFGASSSVMPAPVMPAEAPRPKSATLPPPKMTAPIGTSPNGPRPQVPMPPPRATAIGAAAIAPPRPGVIGRATPPKSQPTISSAVVPPVPAIPAPALFPPMARASTEAEAVDFETKTSAAQKAEGVVSDRTDSAIHAFPAGEEGTSPSSAAVADEPVVAREPIAADAGDDAETRARERQSARELGLATADSTMPLVKDEPAAKPSAPQIETSAPKPPEPEPEPEPEPPVPEPPKIVPTLTSMGRALRQKRAAERERERTATNIKAAPERTPEERAAARAEDDAKRSTPRPTKNPTAQVPITTASSSLPPPSAAQVATSGPSPACPQCEAPMAWVEEHLRFYCKACRMYF